MTTLAPHHLADLQRSGLSDDTIAQAGIQTVPPRNIRKRLGFDFSDLDSMYEIPYPNRDGFSRFRCFPAENKKIAKYLQPKDSGCHLYVPPQIVKKLAGHVNPNEPTYITEGEKKALKASQEGLNCVAIGGLWNWKDKNGGLISELEDLVCPNRVFHIIPDNDWQLPNKHGYKKNLEQAVRGLTNELAKRGARVFIVELPEGHDKGLDDYLITHSVAEFLALPAKEFCDLSIEEKVAKVTMETLDDILKEVAKIQSQVKQAALVAELAKLLKVPKMAIKNDLKRYNDKLGANQHCKTREAMTAIFPGLVDLVEDEGTVAFLIKSSSGLRVETAVDIDDVQHIPPAKEHLPFLLPRADKCLKCYNKTGDPTLFDDLLTYFRRFSFLPDDHWVIIGLSTLSTYLQDHNDIHYQAMILFYAVPERGKSRTGKAVIYAAYRGVHLVDMRETNIFRFSGYMAATLFFDIKDLWKKVERNGSEDVLLLRYEKGAKVSRVLCPEKGAFEDTVHFSIHGPTIMASNADVHKILGSRCLTFTMPNAPGHYENPTPELGQMMKERLVAWRARMMDSPLPDILEIDGISGRLWDITKPLFQICRVACPERYEDFVKTILDIAGQRVQEKKASIHGLLIQAIYDLTHGDADHFEIKTSDVTTTFNKLWKGAESKSKEWIGRQLKALGIKTDTKTGRSIIHLDRKTLEMILAQYGFTRHGAETSSISSIISKDSVSYEVPIMVNCELQNTSRADTNVNSNCFEDIEVSEVIPEVLTKSAEKKNWREVRI